MKARLVTFVQRVLPHYRVDLFRGLRQQLASAGVELRLYYGQEQPGTVPRTVDIEEPWAHRIRNRYLWLPRDGAVLHRPGVLPEHPDLVIVEHAARLLANYWWYWRRRSGQNFRLGLWGHGSLVRPVLGSSLAARLRWLPMNVADWYFAYTQSTIGQVLDAGFPEDRVTNVQNAIETKEFSAALADVSAEQMSSLRTQLNLSGRHVALYCGGLYASKRLDFLVGAATEIRLRVPDFELIVIGDGPESCKIQTAACRHSWIHYVGPITGPERAPYFALSSVFLMPGLVGLAIVDALVAQVPLFTTDIPIHSPEIAYLQPGKNGVITPGSIGAYAEAVTGCLLDRSRLETMKAGCRDTAKTLTLEEMIRRFSGGIIKCLRAPRRQDA